MLAILINCVLIINSQNIEQIIVTDGISKFLPVPFSLRKSQVLEQCIATEVSVVRVNLINIRTNINISYKNITSSHEGTHATNFTPIIFRINL